jgi:tripartite-type tricarboxylate transporter receptor subunit TctC
VQVGIWHGLYVPAGTPDEVIAKLNEALVAALRDPNVIARFAELGTAPVPLDQATPEAHGALLAAQIELWSPIIKAAGEMAQ